MQYPQKISRCELGTDNSVKIHLANLVRLHLMELEDELGEFINLAIRKPASDICTLVKSWIQKLGVSEHAVIQFAGYAFKVIPVSSDIFEIKMQLQRL